MNLDIPNSATSGDGATERVTTPVMTGVYRGATSDAVDPKVALGARIKQLRQQRGLSQRELAGDLLSPSYVSLLEAGRRAPAPAVMQTLAERLGTTADALTGFAAPPVVTSVEAQLELRWAKIALANGDAADAVPPLRRLLDSEDLGDAEHREAQRLLALALELDGRLMEAIEMLESTSAEPTEHDLEGWTAARTQLCRCYKEIGDLDRAIDVGEAVQRRLEGLEPTDSQAVLATTLGGAYYERGDLARASHVLTKVLTHADQRGTHRTRGGALWNSSLVAAAENRLDEALMLAERALAILGESDNTRNLARLKVAYAWLQLETGHDDVDPIRRLLLHARIDLEAEGSVAGLAACLTELARCDLLSGQLQAAGESAEHAMALARGTGTAEGARARAVLGQALLLSGDHAAGAEAMRTAAQDLERLAARREAARVWRDLAELAEHVGDATTAKQSLEAAAAALGIVPRSVRALLRIREAGQAPPTHRVDVVPTGAVDGTAGEASGRVLDDPGASGPVFSRT